MKNNSEFSKQMFTWSLDKSNSNSSNEDMSENELLQMILGEEAKQTNSDSSDDMMFQKAPTSSISKLDFRPVHEDIPDTDLQTMSIKEKRQLRNKISARNFRNRRKEYISNMEDAMTLQKNENAQLKLEIKWLKTKMEKMQKENDKLRLDLMLANMNQQQQQVEMMPQQQQQQVVSPPRMVPQQHQTTTTTTPAFLFDSSTLVNYHSGSSNSSSSSDGSTLSSPPNLFTEFPDIWDFVLPTDNNDAYLSHALVPDWNINRILSKETTQFTTAPNVFQKYPLLAPALMSIVIQHTMNMSTDEMLATAKLYPPSVLLPPYSKPNIVAHKQAQAAWNLLEPLQQMEKRNQKIAEEKQEEITTETKEQQEEFCPIAIVTSTICNFVYGILSQYVNCEKDNTKQAQQESTSFLCKRFQRVKGNVTAC